MPPRKNQHRRKKSNDNPAPPFPPITVDVAPAPNASDTKIVSHLEKVVAGVDDARKAVEEYMDNMPPPRQWKETRHGRVAVLTFTNPPVNLMKRASLRELEGHLISLMAMADEVSVVMLTGGVDGYFVAHACLDELELLSKEIEKAKLAATERARMVMAEGPNETADGDADGGGDASQKRRNSVWRRVLRLLEEMPQPTVAAIDGQAHGGGLEICLACTMRIASERSHMALPEVTVGLIPGAGGTQRLPRLVGQGIASEMCITGRRVLPDEALRMGLINAKLPTKDFVNHAIRWCDRIAVNQDGAIQAAKRAVQTGSTLPLDEALDEETRLFVERLGKRFPPIPSSKL